MTSQANGRRMRPGRFELPSLAELRKRREPYWTGQGLRFDQIVADVQSLTAQPGSAGAVFQVASQFNMLEMVSPDVTPERGVDGYEHDHTQGPACAIACGAGTIYRNYFVPVDGGMGQTSTATAQWVVGSRRRTGRRHRDAQWLRAADRVAAAVDRSPIARRR